MSARRSGTGAASKLRAGPGPRLDNSCSVLALAETPVRWRIHRRPRITHFLAQTCHENAGFWTAKEFASGAAYEGPGLVQLTGRANYHHASEDLGADLTGTPELAATLRSYRP